MVGVEVVELAVLVVEERQEALDVLRRGGRGPLGEDAAHVVLQLGVAPLAAAEADDDELLGQVSLAHQVEERRHDLARHQVAGRAEDDQDRGRDARVQAVCDMGGSSEESISGTLQEDSHYRRAEEPRTVKIIDIHTHAWPDAVAPNAIASLERLGTLTAFYDGTVAGLRGSMERRGVVGVGGAAGGHQGEPGDLGINDWAASIAGDGIVPFGAMHPELEDPAAEIARMASLGLRGIKLHPEHQAFAPDEPRWRRSTRPRSRTT